METGPTRVYLEVFRYLSRKKPCKGFKPVTDNISAIKKKFFFFFFEVELFLEIEVKDFNLKFMLEIMIILNPIYYTQ